MRLEMTFEIYSIPSDDLPKSFSSITTPEEFLLSFSDISEGLILVTQTSTNVRYQMCIMNT